MVQKTHAPDPATLASGAGTADHANGGYDQPVAATGATAGIPGTWTPPGSTPPADIPALQGSSIVASPASGWTSGQYVQTQLAGAAGRACWTGTGWVGGAAPLSSEKSEKSSERKAEKPSTEGRKSHDS